MRQFALVEFDAEKGLEDPSKSHYVLSRQVSAELFGCSVGCAVSILGAILIVQSFALLNRLHMLLQVGIGLLLSVLLFAVLWQAANGIMYLLFGRRNCPHCSAQLHRRGDTFCVVCGKDWTNPIQVQQFEYGTPVPPDARAAAAERNPFYLLLEDPRARQIVALALMNWQLLGDPKHGDSLVRHLQQAARCLPNLRFLTLYFDWDIDLEDADDLQDGDLREYFPNHDGDLLAVLDAYPNLEYLKVQADVANFSKFRHTELKAFVVHEYLGPRVEFVQRLGQAELPELEHLEIWFEPIERGGVLEALRAMLDGDQFPKLRSLAFCGCPFADSLALEVAQSKLGEHLEVLNFSRGNLGEAGVRVLMDCGLHEQLSRFDFHHHYVPKELVKALKQTIPEVDARDAQEQQLVDGVFIRGVAPSNYRPKEWQLSIAVSESSEN